MRTWKFRLTNDTRTINFGSNRVRNWSEIESSLVESETLRGTLFGYTNIFEFTEEVKTFITNILDTQGVDAVMHLQMWTGNESGHRSSFKEYGNQMKAVFIDTYNVDETTVKLSFAASEFEEMLMNRMDTEIEYDIEESIDGNDIGAAVYVDALLHDRVLDGIAEWETKHVGIVNSGVNSSVIMYGKYSSIQGTADVYVADGLNYIFSSQYDGNSVSGTIKNISVSTNSPILLTISKVSVLTDNDELFFSEVINSQSEFPLVEFDSIFNQGDILLISYASVFTSTTTINIEQTKIFQHSTFPYSETKGLRPYDVLERQIEKITGKANAFSSTFLGYTESGYTVDGYGAFMCLFNGKLIRSFSTLDSKIRFSFKDLLSNYMKAFNLVAWIKDDIFYLEKYEDAYDLNDVLKLSGAISQVKASLYKKDYVANIKYGCNNVTYEEVNALDSFIGLYERQTQLKASDVSLDLVVPYRYDDYGIEFTRRLPYVTNPTLDYRTDSDIFMIHCRRNGDNRVASIQGLEGSTVSGILSPNTAYNLELRAENLLKNWYKVLATGLYLQPEKKIKFVRGAKNTNLIIDGVGSIDDILVSSLGAPAFLPYRLEFEAEITDEEYNTIILNPRKTVQVGQLFGVAKKFTCKANENSAKFELKRANR